LLDGIAGEAEAEGLPAAEHPALVRRQPAD
jgi:hypothetical protein